ncbi:type IV toxin-antitoxin system AbiEi family antitoxin [Nocardia sp. FBN12]|uniref:type IV toxin-antitoxin system AbiEi family antitoxin n=1 Tax=Nocardia sp. FBN12 TaxID=3419766 RepID=UPI003CFD2ECD
MVIPVAEGYRMLAHPVSNVHYLLMFTLNERQGMMNILDAAMSHLDARGISFETLETTERPGSGSDLIARLDAGSRGDRTYAVEIRGRITSSVARALPSTELPLLLVAPHISREAAEVLQRREIDFVDTVGNMTLAWPSLYVCVVGNSGRSTARPASARAPRAFSPAGAKVLFTLLSWSDAINMPLRYIAERSGTSLGTAQIVMSELERSGYVASVGERRQLLNGRELLDRWTEAFSTAVVPRISMADFADNSNAWWLEAMSALLVERAQLGGEAAGSQLDSELRSTTGILYVDVLPRALAAERRWHRAGDEPNVIIRQRFWRPTEPLDPLVPSTLIFADMWASGDSRQRAHAERIRKGDPRLVEIDRS